MINADGSNVRDLTPHPGRGPGHGAADPAWSPDGRTIAFVRWASPVGGHEDVGFRSPEAIYVVQADGSGLRNLTPKPVGTYVAPAWSPDGRKIAFVSDRDGNSEIYVMNADGSGQRSLTRNPSVRRRSRLVARRAQDRLRQQPRRQLRGLRHERGRQRTAEAGATQPVALLVARWATA